MNTKDLVTFFVINPTQRNFNLIKDNYTVLSLVYEVIKDKTGLTAFFKTFEAWQDVYDHTFGNLKAIALRRMGEFDRTFLQWSDLWKNSSGEKKALALRKMGEFN